jgi:hypothetical protein
MGGGRCVCDDTVDELRELTEREWAAEMRGWAGKELGGESRLAGWPPPASVQLDACASSPVYLSIGTIRDHEAGARRVYLR